MSLSIFFMLLATGIMVWANVFPAKVGEKEKSDKVHLKICIGIALGGCLLRVLAFLFLPAVGEEEMHLTEEMGQLLLSGYAMFAAYGIGLRLSGRRAGLFCLLLYAWCPYFVVATRWINGANIGVFVLPIALYVYLRGEEDRFFRCFGAALFGLLTNLQTVYGYALPLAMLGMTFVLALHKEKWQTLLLSLAAYTAAALPALLRLGSGTDFAYAYMPANASMYEYSVELMKDTLWKGVFQLFTSPQVPAVYYAPQGLGTLYYCTVPLMLLGGVALLWRRFEQGGVGGSAGVMRKLVMVVCICIVGVRTFLWDKSALTDGSMLFFAVLLGSAGLCHMRKTSTWATFALLGIYGLQSVMLGVRIIGG